MQDCVGPPVQLLHHLLSHPPRAVTVIELTKVDDLLGEDRHLGHAHPLPSGTGGALLRRHDEAEQLSPSC